MNIIDYKDFYIDLNGDVKASVDNKFAKFLTTSDKLDSQYLVANNLDELWNCVKSVNTMFQVDDKNLLRQYSLKRDNNGNLVGVKLYSTQDQHQINSINYILVGYDINSVSYDMDYYFTATIEEALDFIKKNSLVYEIKEFETHKPFLFSLKTTLTGQIINFKTYYTLNENVAIYKSDIVDNIKKVLKFR
jgi:hypothetical protein